MNEKPAASGDTHLHFQSSKHRFLGMEGPLVESLRDNAPRIVGALRLASILMAATVHPLLGMHAVFVLGSEVVLLLFGNREEVGKNASEKPEKEEKSFLGQVGKAFQPHKYPLESSAALDVLGEVSHLLFGAMLVFDFDIPGIETWLGENPSAHADHSNQPVAMGMQHLQESSLLTDSHGDHHHLTGMALLIHGVLGVASHLPLWLLGPEKAGQHAGHLDLSGDDITPKKSPASLEFSNSNSTIVGTKTNGLVQWFKDHQVMISSVLQMAIAVTMMVAVGMPPLYRWAGVPLLLAAGLQATLVKKRDFSADGVAESRVHDAVHDGKLHDHEQQQDIQPTFQLA